MRCTHERGTEHRYEKTYTTPETTFTVEETNASVGIQLARTQKLAGVKNEKSNLFESSILSWCTLGMNQAAIEAIEIEAQLVLQLLLATWHRVSQGRQILAEHGVVNAFAVYLCP